MLHRVDFFYIDSKCTKICKGPVTLPTIVDLGQKVRSNLISIVQFFVLILNLASDLPYVAYFGGKLTSKFGLPEAGIQAVVDGIE